MVTGIVKKTKMGFTNVFRNDKASAIKIAAV